LVNERRQTLVESQLAEPRRHGSRISSSSARGFARRPALAQKKEELDAAPHIITTINYPDVRFWLAAEVAALEARA
jgi:hypothetical protein